MCFVQFPPRATVSLFEVSPGCERVMCGSCDGRGNGWISFKAQLQCYLQPLRNLVDPNHNNYFMINSADHVFSFINTEIKVKLMPSYSFSYESIKQVCTVCLVLFQVFTLERCSM